MMRIRKRFGRKALAVAACALAVCLCAGAAFAGNLENSAVFAEDVNDVPAPAANAAPVAEPAGGVGSSGDSAGADDGVVLNKTAKANGDGSYTITLEAYATGEQTTVVETVPADIVLVLDTSGSMKYGMTSDDYEEVYIPTNHQPTQYESYMIIRNSEYMVAMYTGSRWAVVSDDNTFGDTVNPKANATDSARNHVQFYKVKDGQSRLDYLKSAVNKFVSSSLEVSSDSQIAVVSFSGKVDGNDPPKAAVVSGFSSNADALQAAVNDLQAKGATYSSDGMSMAKDLLAPLASNGHKKVVVMFTDGAPSETISFSEAVANGAISASRDLKKEGVSVYTIGVFAGADGSLSSVDSDYINRYMHYVSSNYPDASSLNDPGSLGEGVGVEKNFYLAADDSEELMDAFERVSEDVGGATNTALGSSTVVKDVIAPSFTVPAGASDIKLYTADCTGAGLDFGSRVEATDVTADIDGDTLSVTGFDFSENWCGDHSGEYDGKKLIIEFTVSPKPGFLGGNDVPTNGAESGIYVAGECIDKFQVPTVNVPIDDVDVSVSDKNVYLTQVPDDSALKSDMTVKCGNVDITDPSKLEAWQTAYVDITGPTVTPPVGFDAKDDATYTVTAKVSPKSDGSTTTAGSVAGEKTGSATGKINVFKPELTFKDSEVWYGDAAPTDYSADNLESTEWAHGIGSAKTYSNGAGVTMIGTAPTLSLTYDPEYGKVSDDGKIASKGDFAVDVTVKIDTTDVTDEIAFVHTRCGTSCTDPSAGEFWLHVNTCLLTVKKDAGENTTIGDDEYFVFDVKKDGKAYTQVVVRGAGSVTISELPVGVYSVSEDSSTAWRYASSFDNDFATLSKGSASATVVCVNTAKNDKWINCFSRVINVFGANTAEANE